MPMKEMTYASKLLALEALLAMLALALKGTSPAGAESRIRARRCDVWTTARIDS
jgi:hypothetical protein